MKMKSKGMSINDVTFLGAKTRNFLNTSDAIEIKIEFADPNLSIKNTHQNIRAICWA
jgi:hypothetical protein